ncbi:MAG: ATP phosphoribosyltransferase regulatory subunit, partial [Chloroflexota bacterium]|nr:ATP phosphoribosyltransferase regulatory subunit [Chloroflexota bacterium]
QRISGGGRYDDLIPLMGGKNVPACGFALYVDTIMKLLPPGNGDEVQILVKGEEQTAEVVRTCFTLAQSLRAAGHATELGFGGKEINDYRWIISVFNKKPFILKDCRQGRQQDMTSTVEILDVIGK